MQRFTDLNVWKRSHALVLDKYRMTAGFPADERFGLVSQMRRAAVSVPANIAEGSKRRHGKDYARFLNIAEGSVAELEYFTILGRDLGFVSEQQVEATGSTLDEIARMLNALRTKVEQSA